MTSSKYYDYIEEQKELLAALMEANIHEIEAGSATLHFDTAGKLRKVEVNKTTYKSS